MLKILFYGYATGIFTSRKLREALDDNIPFRWLSGGLKPDHRTISDFRKNNLPVLPGLFRQIIQIARDLGYISLGHVSIDGSKIKANASKHKAMSWERMKQEIIRLEKEIAEILEKAQSDDRKEEEASVVLPETVDEMITDRKARVQKIKDALQRLESRKPEADSYICPAGKTLNFKQAYADNKNGVTKRIYECLECQECALKNDCAKSKTGKRTMSRTEADPIREAMRTKVQSDTGKAIYRLRKAIVEPAWGQLKECQGFRQFHLRGEKKVEGEFILLALSYNLRKIHSAKYPKKSTQYKQEKSAQKRKNVV